MLTEQNIEGILTIKAVRRNVGGCTILAESFDGKQTLLAEYPDVLGRKLAFQRAVRDGKLRHTIALLLKGTRERHAWSVKVADAKLIVAAEELGIDLDYDVTPDVFPMGV
jgi:hypothetical protein